MHLCFVGVFVLVCIDLGFGVSTVIQLIQFGVVRVSVCAYTA